MGGDVSQRFSEALAAQGEPYYHALQSLAQAMRENQTPGMELIVQPPEPVHHFAQGVYGRELRIPAGQVVISRIHKKGCINVLLEGAVTVANGSGEPVLYEAPCVFVSPAGAQRLLYTHTDVRWLNAHASIHAESGDIEALEAEIACYTLDEYKQAAGILQEAAPCLGGE